MGQILLTPEEVKGNYLTYYTKRFNSETEAQDFVENLNIGAGKFMAKAQLKKVVKYLDTLTFYDDWGGESGKKTVEMIQQALLKEVEERKEVSSG